MKYDEYSRSIFQHINYIDEHLSTVLIATVWLIKVIMWIRIFNSECTSCHTQGKATFFL